MSEQPEKYSLEYYRDLVARLPRPTDAECYAAAADYAETRRTEIRAQLEALADELAKPFGPDARKWPFGGAAVAYQAAAEAIREIARG